MKARPFRMFIAWLAVSLLIAGCGSGPASPTAPATAAASFPDTTPSGQIAQAAAPTPTAAPPATMQPTQIPDPTATSTPTKTPTPAATLTPAETAVVVVGNGGLTGSPVPDVTGSPVPDATGTPLPTATTAAGTPAPVDAKGPMAFVLEGVSGGLPWRAEGYNCQGIYGTWKIHETMDGTTPEGMVMKLAGDLTGDLAESGSGPISGAMDITFSAGPVNGSLSADFKGTISLAGTADAPKLSIKADATQGQAQAAGPGASLSMPFQGADGAPTEVAIHAEPGYPKCQS